MSGNEGAVHGHEDPADAGGPAVSLPARWLDVVGGLVLGSLAGWLWWGAGDIEATSRAAVGPDTFPRGVAILLGLSSLLLVAQGIVPRVFSLAAERVATVRRPGAVVAALVLVVAYPVLITHLGYYPATAIFLPPLLWVAGLRRLLGIVASTVGFLVFTKLLFEMLLGIPMP